uniref:Uncharacterized protein n=1 Tax=uncultured marine bacterium 440 TaxID=257390 RepID=Q6SHC7_9BACT|nr:hypothetical protein MBMO_EBAC750-02H05.11 [uncultured marine bacterium 440]
MLLTVGHFFHANLTHSFLKSINNKNYLKKL